MRTRAEVALDAADVGNGSAQDTLIHYPAVSALFRRPIPTALSRSDSGIITAKTNAAHAWRLPRLRRVDRLTSGSRSSPLSPAGVPWSMPSHTVGIFGQTGPGRNTNSLHRARAGRRTRARWLRLAAMSDPSRRGFGAYELRWLVAHALDRLAPLPLGRTDRVPARCSSSSLRECTSVRHQ